MPLSEPQSGFEDDILPGAGPTPVEPGNIDLSHRPQVKNPDGSISTVRSMSFNFDGQEVLLPTVSPEGMNWTPDQAIENYRKTGKHLGKFASVEEANKAAKAIHEAQALQVTPGAPRAKASSGFENDLGDMNDVQVPMTDATPEPSPQKVLEFEQAQARLAKGEYESEDEKSSDEATVGQMKFRLAEAQKAKGAPEINLMREKAQARWGKEKIGFFENFYRKIPQGAPGIAEKEALQDFLAIGRLDADDYKGDDQQRSEDENRLARIMNESEEEWARGTTTLGEISGSAAQLPGYVLAFILSGGTAAAGKASAESAVMTAIRKYGQKQALSKLDRVAIKAVVRGAGAVGGVAGRLPLLIPSQGIQEAAGRQKAAHLTLTENGVEWSKKALESPNKSLLLAAINTVVDTGAEESGGVLGAGIRKVVSPFIPKPLLRAAERIWVKTKPGRTVQQLYTKAGLHEFEGELSEELAGGVMKSVLGTGEVGGYQGAAVLDRIGRDWPGFEEFLVLSGTIGLQSLGMRAPGAMNYVMNRKKQMKYQEPPEPHDIPDAELDQLMNPTEEAVTTAAQAEQVPTEVPEGAVVTPAEEPAISKPLAQPKLNPAEEAVATMRLETVQKDLDATVKEMDMLKEEREALATADHPTKDLDEARVKLAEKHGVADTEMQEATADVERLQAEMQTSEAPDREMSRNLEKAWMREERALKALVRVEEQINDLDKRLEARKGAGYSTKALDEKITATEAKFDELAAEEGSLRTNLNLMMEAPTVNKNAKIVTKAGKLMAALKKVAASAKKMTQEEIQAAQKELVDIIEQSDLLPTERHRFTRLITNVQSQKDLGRVLPQVEARIGGIVESRTRRTLATKIFELLKGTKAKTRYGKPVGNLTADIQKALDTMREASKMSAIDAEMAVNDILNKLQGEEPSPGQLFELAVLQNFSDLKGRSPEDLADLLERVKLLIKTGRLTAIQKRADEAAQLDAERASVIETIQGEKPVKPTDSPEPGRVKAFAQKFLSRLGMYGWDDLMDVFSRDSRTRAYDSPLSRIADVHKVEQKEKLDVAIRLQQFQDQVMKLFGFESKRQFEKQIAEDHKMVDYGTRTDAAGNEFRLVISKAQVRKMYMESLDPTLEEARTTEEGGYVINGREVNGLTPQLQEELFATLGQKDIELAQLQLKLYKEIYQDVNAVYRERYGVDLPFNEFYSPLRRSIEQKDVVSEIVNEADYRRGTAPSLVKTRRRNFEKIEAQSDIEAFRKHVLDAYHFTNWAAKIKQLQNIFGNRKVAGLIKEKFGPGALQLAYDFIDDFRAGHRSLERVQHNAISAIRRGFVGATLGLNPSQLIKQFTGHFGYLRFLTPTEYVTGMTSFLKNPKEAIATLKKSGFFKTRGSSIDRDIQIFMNESKAFIAKPTVKNLFAMFTRWGDLSSIYPGAWAIYQKALKEGKTPEKALEEAERRTLDIQPSSDTSQLSAWQRSGAFGELFTMFLSSPNKYYRKEAAAIRNLLAGRVSVADAAKTLFVYHILLPQIFQLAANAGRWDDDEQLLAAILGPANGVFILGDILDSLSRRLLNASGFTDLDTYEFDAVPLFKIVKDLENQIEKMDFEDFDAEEFAGILGNIAKDVAAPVAGVPLENALDAYEGIEDIMNGDVKVGAAKLLGWSPRTAERLGKE